VAVLALPALAQTGGASVANPESGMAFGNSTVDLLAYSLSVKKGKTICGPVNCERVVSVTFSVKNVGNTTAYNFTDQINVTGPEMHASNFAVGSLAPGITVSHSQTYLLEYGNYTVTGIADIFNDVLESDETNNIASKPLSLP